MTEMTFSGSLHFRNGPSLHNCVLEVSSLLLLAAMFLSSCAWKTAEDGAHTFLGTSSSIAPPPNEEAFSGVHSQTVICGYFPLYCLQQLKWVSIVFAAALLIVPDSRSIPPSLCPANPAQLPPPLLKGQALLGVACPEELRARVTSGGSLVAVSTWGLNRAWKWCFHYSLILRSSGGWEERLQVRLDKRRLLQLFCAKDPT